MPPVPNSAEAKVVIAGVRKSLIEMALWDIHRIFSMAPPKSFVKRTTELTDGKQAIASSFVLGCCLIEAAGHYIIQSPPRPVPGNRPKSQSHKAFTQFCKEFLKRGYNEEVLYSAMRCGMAHAYTTSSDDPNVPETYWLTHNNIAAHLQQDKGDARIRYVNCQNFVVDLTLAITEFFDAVVNNSSLLDGTPAQPRFLEWAEISGFMAVQNVPATAVAPARAAALPPTAAPATPAPALWRGVTPPTLMHPLAGVGAGKLSYMPTNGALNSTLSLTASGWSGYSDLGVAIGGWTIRTHLTPTYSVNVGPNFKVRPPIEPKKKKKR